MRTEIVRFGIENKYISERFIEINIKHVLLINVLPTLLKIN